MSSVPEAAIGRRLRATVPGDDDGVARAVARFAERAAREGLLDVAWTNYDAPIGPLMLAATDSGLVRIGLHPDEGMLEDLADTVSPRVVEHPTRLDAVRRQLDEYFAGRRRTFDVALDWRLSKGFRLEVLRRLFDDVGFGETVSYGQLADLVGRPRASRAVGGAMATNPVPIVVPCHRVLDSAGHLHGYGGGLPMKEALLRHEGVLLPQ